MKKEEKQAIAKKLTALPSPPSSSEPHSFDERADAFFRKLAQISKRAL